MSIHFQKLTQVLLCLFFLSACGKEKANRVLIPEVTAEGDTRLSEVTIETLPDVHVAQGPVAVVYENPLHESESFRGKPAEPRLIQSGSVWIPTDTKSSTALALYYGYELIKKFDDKVFPESRVKWPRQVAFDLNLKSGVANNAFYAPFGDLTVFLPFKSSGLPMAYNSGILAHEHFHAHFHSLVGESVIKKLEFLFQNGAQAFHSHSFGTGCGFSVTSAVQMEADSSDFRRLVNFFILRGWNEGLADLYATLVFNNTNFMDISLNHEGSRKVDQLVFLMTPRRAFEEAVRSDIAYSSRPECSSLAHAYHLGTQVARVLYAALLNGEEKLSLEVREKSARIILQTLKELNSSIVSQIADELPSPSWLLEELLKAFGKEKDWLPPEIPKALPSPRPDYTPDMDAPVALDPETVE